MSEELCEQCTYRTKQLDEQESENARVLGRLAENLACPWHQQMIELDKFEADRIEGEKIRDILLESIHSLSDQLFSYLREPVLPVAWMQVCLDQLSSRLDTYEHLPYAEQRPRRQKKAADE